MRWYIWILILWLVACGGESGISPEAPPLEVKPEPAIGTIAMNQGVDEWKFREMPLAPATSALIETETGFALDPNWQIAEIEYDYDWGGLGIHRDKPNQIVNRKGDAFIRNDQVIAIQTIEAFVHSIERFHPSQFYISGYRWTDDYPSHTIQITGVDGQQIVISASSTGNPGDGPWNLIYNGRLYAQYDGAFGYGMDGIFDYVMRGTDTEMFGDIFSDTIEFTPAISFSTYNLPPQLEDGFEGLFPISDHFSYTADVTTGEIKGEIIGRIFYGEYEQEPIYSGTFAELHSITLLPNTSSAVACVIEPMTLPNRENKEGDAAWSFTCPMGVVAQGTPYLYPIEVQLQDNDGNPVTLNGTLSGG